MTAAQHSAQLTGVAEVSDGRAAMLALKSAELRREWIRAENAEGRCERLREALTTYAAHLDFCDRRPNGIDGDCQCGLFWTLENA